MDLLGYASSDDDSGVTTKDTKRKPDEDLKEQFAKRLKQLPKLPNAFRTAPIDDPSDHQGRARSRRWVEGDWNAHVFLKLNISPALRNVLNAILHCAQEELSRSGYAYSIHPLYDAQKADLSLNPPSNSKNDPPSLKPQTHKELHISLTHPLPLRSHQIPTLLEHLKVQLSQANTVAVKPFRLGLDCRVVKYRNGIARAGAAAGKKKTNRSVSQEEVLEDYEDDNLLDAKREDGQVLDTGAKDQLAGLGTSGVGKGGRAFLALRVRAGHAELERVQSQIIDPFLRIHHLPTYHSHPEFHTSFAWVLVPVPEETTDVDASGSRSPAKLVDDPFTSKLLSLLEDQFGQALLDAQPKGGWQVDRISTKIGKTSRDFELAS